VFFRRDVVALRPSAYTTRAMPRNSSLSRDGRIVDVWLAPPTARARFDAAALTDAQRATWASLRTERRRCDYEVSRALSRAVASESSPARSLSHSRGYAALAVAEQGAVGVDVEVCVPRDGAALAAAAFTTDEARFVAARTHAIDRALAFYEIWVLKEACAKALGVPLVDVLHGTNFAAALAGDTTSHGAMLDATDWAAWVFVPRPELRVGVFSVGPEFTVELEPRQHEWPRNGQEPWRLAHRLGHAGWSSRVRRA
jgi:hypothetical protein